MVTNLKITARWRPKWPQPRLFAAFAVMLALPATLIQASPPQDADQTLAPWFESLRQPGTGVSCCSIADCRMTDYRTAGDGYEAFIEDRWVPVPREKVLDHIDNPTGRAVVCYLPGMGILCFVRPAET
jgi:hypothetical protein